MSFQPSVLPVLFSQCVLQREPKEPKKNRAIERLQPFNQIPGRKTQVTDATKGDMVIGEFSVIGFLLTLALTLTRNGYSLSRLHRVGASEERNQEHASGHFSLHLENSPCHGSVACFAEVAVEEAGMTFEPRNEWDALWASRLTFGHVAHLV